MKCDTCKKRMDYCFYINDEYWIDVVGEDSFKKNVGILCAHCTLQKLGGLQWYIIFNEPLANVYHDNHVSVLKDKKK